MKKFPAVWAYAVLFAFSGFARDVTVTVVDADLGIPLEGAKIRLSTGGAEYECDGNGKAVITAPDGTSAIIQAAYPGYENARMVIPPRGDSFTLAMRLGSVLDGKELVIEARKPAESESRVGRSVTISGSEITQSAQIGIVEDVMNAVKLLPGVGFTGMFSALPSVRGGDPGDLTAALDGFYISSPYHWGGMFSIFDPAMTASARLSHGVFSARYGHTISGLLEVTGKKPSPTEVMFDLGLSSSAANFNISYPFAGKGGMLLMGKITYWDPFVWVMKQFIDIVNYVTVAPYIRDLALNANYRFTDSLELWGSAFFGSDGAAAYWDNAGAVDYADKIDNDMRGAWLNLTGYALAGITWNPSNSMLVKTSAGAGFLRQEMDVYIKNDIRGIRYSQDFINQYGTGANPLITPDMNGEYTYSIQNKTSSLFVNTDADVQWRGDFDWDLGAGFVFAAGAEERYLWQIVGEDNEIWTEQRTPLASSIPGFAHYAVAYKNHTKNGALTSSAYSLVEYTSPQKIIDAELGLRFDHLWYLGEDQNIQTLPVVNPRLNVDWTALKNSGIIGALTFTAGTGLFSSVTDSLFSIRRDNKVDDFELKQNRAWTSILGTKIDFERALDESPKSNITSVGDGFLPVTSSKPDIVCP
ncbi:MAG: hypothetical protein Pg6C_07700 [Treponemataceae bacterium]|nr:MAG: hypothetical protein Pg6C_07700 [Treponemataceae bacterium]